MNKTRQIKTKYPHGQGGKLLRDIAGEFGVSIGLISQIFRKQMTNKGIGARGFASLSPERRMEIARMGGKRAFELGTGYRWTSKTARIASNSRVNMRGGKVNKS